MAPHRMHFLFLLYHDLPVKYAGGGGSVVKIIL